MKVVVAALLASLALGSAQAQQTEVTFTLTGVARGIYMLQGQGGNIGLSVGADGVFMVDDQYAPLTEGIRAEIAKITDQPVRFLINTHWHGDHTGGNESLRGTGTVIVAHDNVRKRMSTDQVLEFLKREVSASPAGALPVITFDSAVSFHLNGEEVRVIHMPRAHTDGDAIVHFTKSNVIHAGDIAWTSGYPFIDIDSGGSINGMVAALDMILSLADENTKIIPGHGPGPIVSPDELRPYRSMLATVRDRVALMVTQGKTLDEVQAARPSEEFDEVWGQRFISPENFVREIYLDQTR